MQCTKKKQPLHLKVLFLPARGGKRAETTQTKITQNKTTVNKEEKKGSKAIKIEPLKEGLSLSHQSIQSTMAEQIIEEEPTNFPPSTSPPSQNQAQQELQTPSNSSMLLLRIMSKRRTWVCLFVGVYTVLLSLSWNFLKSVLAWYETTLMNSSSSSGSSSVYSGWPALYASVLLGVAFGVLSMVAALAVAVPATLVTWITVLVLLTFCGKPRRALVTEGKKLTAEITGFVAKVLIKEGNIVAALCAVVGYFAFVRKGKENGTPGDY